jgi:hypothetical protein
VAATAFVPMGRLGPVPGFWGTDAVGVPHSTTTCSQIIPSACSTSQELDTNYEAANQRLFDLPLLTTIDSFVYSGKKMKYSSAQIGVKN